MFTKAKAVLRSNRVFYRSFRRVRNRYRLLCYGLRHVDPTFYVSAGCRISRDLVAGEYGFIGDGCVIGPGVKLGRYVMFAPRVAVVGADHSFDKAGTPMIFAGRPPLHPTVIEADVWVGYGSVIMTGVTIARGAIIAAGAVVTKSVPPYEVWGGVPARKLRERFTSEQDRHTHDLMLAGAPEEGDYAGGLFQRT